MDSADKGEGSRKNYDGQPAWWIVNALYQAGMSDHSIAVAINAHYKTIYKIRKGQLSGERCLARLKRLFDVAN